MLEILNSKIKVDLMVNDKYFAENKTVEEEEFESI
jgi:hypothetical protein